MRALLVASVLCGATSSCMMSDNAPCAADPLVASWVRRGGGQTWAIHADCTWSLSRSGGEDTGTWSRSGANAIFVPDPPSQAAMTTVTPERIGDRLAISVVQGPGPVVTPPLVSSTGFYAK